MRGERERRDFPTARAEEWRVVCERERVVEACLMVREGAGGREKAKVKRSGEW